MEERNILLTYEHVNGYKTFEWFEDIEECNDFIEIYRNYIKEIIECQEVKIANDVMMELDFKN
jgi:hypothetical protein